MKNDFTARAFLSFSLGDEKFAINVEGVQEIVELGHVTKVPNCPDYMLGIINLRGRILPLLDTKLKLGLPPIEKTNKNRIVILELKGSEEKVLQIGALVDVAREVVEFREEEILETPEFENHKTSVPVTGIVNQGGNITMILDIEKVFSNSDVAHLNQSVESK